MFLNFNKIKLIFFLIFLFAEYLTENILILCDITNLNPLNFSKYLPRNILFV